MMAEKDLGSSLLFFALFMAMLWVATERAAYLGVGAVLFACGLAASRGRRSPTCRAGCTSGSTRGPTRRRRVSRSCRACSRSRAGGIAGTGLGARQPAAHPGRETDFIFAAIGEELGLFGTTAILVAFLLMVGAGLRIALRADTPFEKLLATGLTTLLGVQAFIIIGGVTRVLPLTGVTLPFVSYGGSSLVANYVLLALLLRISDDSAERQAAASGRRRDPGAVTIDEQQIRRLGVGLWSCSSRCSATSTTPGLRRRQTLNNDPRTPAPWCATSASRAAPSSAADGAVLARSDPTRTTPSSSSASTRRRACSAHVTGYFSFIVRHRRASSAPTTTSSPGATEGRSCAGLGDILLDKDALRNVTLTLTKRLQQVAARRAGRPPGLGRRPRPARRRGPRALELPVLRPQPARRPQRWTRCSANMGPAERGLGQAAAAHAATVSASSRARRSRSSPRRPR